MPIDKVLSTKGNPVFGLSPETLPNYYRVRSTPWIVDGPTITLPRNPNLSYVYNTLLADVLNNRTHEYKGGPTGLMTPLYKPGGLLYQRPASVNP